MLLSPTFGSRGNLLNSNLFQVLHHYFLFFSQTSWKNCLWLMSLLIATYLVFSSVQPCFQPTMALKLLLAREPMLPNLTVSSIQSAQTTAGSGCGSDHELLIAKFRLKLKKLGKTTRPFRYDLKRGKLVVKYYKMAEKWLEAAIEPLLA